MNVWADKINQLVMMVDVLERYHVVGKRGRTNCPLHSGKDDNLSYNNHVFQCFVCGAKGNAISFVMQLFNLEFKQAISKINYDFGLNLPVNEQLTNKSKQNILKLQRERRKEREQTQKAVKTIDEKYWKIFDEWKRLDDNIRDYKPHAADEPLHPLFVEAIKNINYQGYLLDIAQTERWQMKNG